MILSNSTLGIINVMKPSEGFGNILKSNECSSIFIRDENGPTQPLCAPPQSAWM